MRVEFSQLESLSVQLLETARTINLSSVKMDDHHQMLNELQDTQEKLISDIEAISSKVVEYKPFSEEESASWERSQSALQKFIRLNQDFFKKFKEINKTS